MNVFDRLRVATLSLAQASGGNPIISTLTVVLFWLMFNVVEGSIEHLIFGKRFVHWLDPVFGACFIAYSAYAVWCCAIWNSPLRIEKHGTGVSR